MRPEKENHGLEVVATGVISGFTGSYASFIFAAAKKRIQSGQDSPSIFKLGLRLWVREILRGSINYSCLLAPTAVVQQAADAWCKNHLPSGQVSQLSGVVCSGALGGVVSSAAENILLRQQIKSMSALAAAKTLYQQSYLQLFRGIWLYMMREAIFGLCYLRGLKQVGDYAKENMGLAYVLPAQIMLGVFCSILSQPIDTMATTMQHHNFTRSGHAFSHLAAQSPAAFYRGGLARAALFTTSALVISYTQNALKTR